MQVVRVVPQGINFYMVMSLEDMKSLKLALDRSTMDLDLTIKEHREADEYVQHIYQTICSSIKEVGDVDSPDSE